MELSPKNEITVCTYTAAEGVSINDLMARYLPPRRVPADNLVLQFLNAQIAEADTERQDFRRTMDANRQTNGECLSQVS